MLIKHIKPEETLNIRHKVLWPNKPVDFCKIDNDKEGIHYGLYVNNQLISVASIFLNNDSARLRKFATLPDFQGQGYGTKLIEFILEDLSRLKSKTFWCDARESAINFYKKFDMHQNGDVFYKSDVRYIVMERSIPSP